MTQKVTTDPYTGNWCLIDGVCLKRCMRYDKENNLCFFALKPDYSYLGRREQKPLFSLGESIDFFDIHVDRVIAVDSEFVTKKIALDTILL